MSAQPSTAPTSQLALASLILGILSWALLPIVGGVGAIICGHRARREIRASRGALGGDGLALAGLVMGYLHLVLIVVGIVAAIVFFGGLIAAAAYFGH